MLERARPTYPPAKISELINKIIEYVSKKYLYSFYNGNAAVETTLGGWFISSKIIIKKIKCKVDTAPAGSSLIFDFYKNGTSIFIDTANRPIIGTGLKDVTVYKEKMGVIDLDDGDVLTWGITQIGSSTAGGSDIYTTVEVE